MTPLDQLKIILKANHIAYRFFTKPRNYSHHVAVNKKSKIQRRWYKRMSRLEFTGTNTSARFSNKKPNHGQAVQEALKLAWPKVFYVVNMGVEPIPSAQLCFDEFGCLLYSVEGKVNKLTTAPLARMETELKTYHHFTLPTNHPLFADPASFSADYVDPTCC